MKMYKIYCKCDKCGFNRAEVDDSLILTSYPPQYNFYCPNCKQHGYVFTTDVTCRELYNDNNDNSNDNFTDDLEIPISPALEGTKITSPESNTITKIGRDSALYVLEKVKKAVEDTINDNTKNLYSLNYAGEKVLIGCKEKTTQEMFETLGDKLQNILNEIKGE